MILHNFETEFGILAVRAFDNVTIDDRIAFVEQVTRDKSLPERSPILIDVTGIANAPTLEDSEKMSILLRVLARRFKSRIAYVVTGVGHLTPYRLATLLVDESVVDAQTFTSPQEARDWLSARLSSE